MRISLKWISRLLGVPALPVASGELQQLLTLRTTEIEADIERVGPRLDGIVVGRVLTCAQHPNADRLRVTTVDVGTGAPLPIVCGAPNVAAGQLVAVATVGTTLTMTGADGVARSLTIKAAKLRGEPSQGMICAEDELGLGASHDGILVLAGDSAPGTPLAAVLGGGDEVLVIDNHGLSHRPDLWGHWGWAVEIAAILGLPAPAAPDTAWQDTPGAWSVELRDEGCLAYAGALVEGVDNRESPAWMRALLEAVGVRPRGLLVDVTNFVMLELGEPMHAFDRREFDGTRIVVRSAAEGETFRTLDGRDHRLASGDLLVADQRRPLALAGIMGGEQSMVKPDTTAVVLEAALFRAERIRRTRVRTGLATDSSARFEKSLYPELAPAAIARAARLLAECCPGARVVQRFSAGALAAPPRDVPWTPGRVARVVGVDIPGDQQLALLHRIGFAAHGERVQVPWWRRKDINAEIDLVEEVARLHGYHHIVPEVPRLPAAAPTPNALRAAEHASRRLLSALAWDEVATYGFTSDAWAGLLAWDDACTIRLTNPLSNDQTVLRRSLLPTLAEAVGRNRKHLPAVAIYELGKRYALGAGTGESPDEELQLCGAVAAAGDAAPFYAARDAALAVLRGLGHAEARAMPLERPVEGLLAARSVALAVGRQRIGVCGELLEPVRRLADCPEHVGWFAIDLERLVRDVGAPRPVLFRAPSRFPAVDREFTWDCPEELPFGALAEHTRAACGALCTGLDLVTIYRGEPYPAGRKAVSLKVVLQAEDRTLEERELQALHLAIKQAVESRTPARLRV